MIKLIQLSIFSLLVTGCSVFAGEAKTILTLGDSITQREDSYRSALIPALRKRGVSYEFIGPNRDKLSAHAGYGGKNTSYLLSISKKLYTQYPADIVLIHSGHNSFSEDKPVPGIIRDTEAIIKSITDINPIAIILLAQVVPAGKLPKYSYIPELNESLSELASHLAKNGTNIVLVNQAEGFDWKTDTCRDKVHVNAAGAKKMANKWLAALLPLLAKENANKELKATDKSAP